MVEFLIILLSSITPAERESVVGVAPPTQVVSDRVFISVLSPMGLNRLQLMDGVACVLTGEELAPSLPPLDDAELLFVQAWLSRHNQVKQRPGEGLDWDTPPMIPPDLN